MTPEEVEAKAREIHQTSERERDERINRAEHERQMSLNAVEIARLTRELEEAKETERRLREELHQMREKSTDF